MISAIILGAGESSRFGSPKILHKIQNRTFLDLILKNINNINEITEKILILGYNYEKIKKNLTQSDNLKILINQNYNDGQLSSFQVGVNNADKNSRGFLMILVDHPLVKQDTYNLLVNEFIKNKYKNIIIPVYENRKGHPVIFPAELKNEILNAPLNKGARFVTHKFINLVKLVNTPDKYILADIDYKKDIKHWLNNIE